MKRCPVCNRSYTDDAMMFCADDGTQLVGEPTAAEPINVAPSAPTLAAPPPFAPPPPASGYQPTPKKRKWLALIALAFGLLAVPFLLYAISGPVLWEFRFRNLSFERIFVSVWGVLTAFGIILTILSVIVALVAIILSARQPARYGGKILAAVGPVLSILLLVLFIGAVAFRWMQGPERFDFDRYSSNANDNSNYNSNRSYNYNSYSNSNSNSDYSYNSNSNSSSASTNMSETDKYRLFYAAAKSGDAELQTRAAKKIGIVDSDGIPTSSYQSFVKGTVNWAFDDRAWVQTMDTTAKAREYAEARL